MKTIQRIIEIPIEELQNEDAKENKNINNLKIYKNEY